MDKSIHKNETLLDFDIKYSSFSFSTNLIAGAISGILEHTIVYPFDSLKTRLQIYNKNLSFFSLSSFKTLINIEKTSLLWRGISSVLISAGPAHAIHFFVFEKSKLKLIKNFNLKNDDTNTNKKYGLISGISGVVATIVSDIFMVPFDVIKQHMQINTFPSNYNNTKKGLNNINYNLDNVKTTFLSIYKKEGINAFFISYPTTVLGNIPFSALNFGSYGFLSSLYNEKDKFNILNHFFIGGISGGIAAMLTTPLDCIKTALQTKGISPNTNLKKISGFANTAKALYVERGISSFFKGLLPRIIINIPSTAISWSSYELVKYLLNKSV